MKKGETYRIIYSFERDGVNDKSFKNIGSKISEQIKMSSLQKNEAVDVPLKLKHQFNKIKWK